MILEGSPQWQQALFIISGVFMLWQLWRGWQLGVVRGMIRLAALFFAWIGGSTAAGATGTIQSFFSKVPPLLAPAVAGLSVGIVIYIVIWILAGLLFKRTEHHVGLVRFGFGIGGALCGLVYGLLFLWAGITLVRGLGACAELRLVQARNEGRAIETERAAVFFIRLKASLELGETGSTLKRVDPIPTAVYDDIVKLSMLAGNSQALEQFFTYPPTLELLKNPRVMAILQDPALQKAADSRNILPLIQNTNVQAAFHDPALLKELKAFDFTAALDFALQPVVPKRPVIIRPEAKSKPSPSPNSHPVKKHATTAPSPSPISTAP